MRKTRFVLWVDASKEIVSQTKIARMERYVQATLVQHAPVTNNATLPADHPDNCASREHAKPETVEHGKIALLVCCVSPIDAQLVAVTKSVTKVNFAFEVFVRPGIVDKTPTVQPVKFARTILARGV